MNQDGRSMRYARFAHNADSADSADSTREMAHSMAKWPWSPSRSNPADSPAGAPMASPSEPETNISVLDPDLIEEPLEPGDHERYSHYVLKDKIVESAVTGKAVRALCGKKWIPGRDPMKFPICPICKEIHEGIRKRDDSNGLGGTGSGGTGGANGSGGSSGSDGGNG